MLALVVQIFAPTIARLAMAEASGRFDILTICSHSNHLDDRQGPAGGHHHPSECCDFCQIANATSAPLVADAFVVFAPANLIRRIDWESPAYLLRVDAHKDHAQARAPPSFS
ncbi:MAG: DUF2946 domain-containing protein [Methylovirgula sp.]